MLEVKVRRLDHAADLPLPAYATSGAAGADVRAAVGQDCTLEAGDQGGIPRRAGGEDQYFHHT